jgi:hypothetical protein
MKWVSKARICDNWGLKLGKTADETEPWDKIRKETLEAKEQRQKKKTDAQHVTPLQDRNVWREGDDKDGGHATCGPS